MRCLELPHPSGLAAAARAAGWVLGLAVAGVAPAETHVFRGDHPLYDQFRDPGFPFLEATVDLRGLAPAGNRDNLIPRGVVLALPGRHYVCFDTELLRVAAVWVGDFVTPEGIAMMSYPQPLKKKEGGQGELPRPRGELWAHTGLYPGWQAAGSPVLEDPRPRWSDPRELGRGPLAAAGGEWLGVEDLGDSVVLHYTARGARVREHFRVEVTAGGPAVVRSVRVEGLGAPAQLLAGAADRGGDNLVRYEVAASAEAQEWCVAYAATGIAVRPEGVSPFAFATAAKARAHWPEEVVTEIEPGQEQGAYAVDHLRLPYPNPWQRRIRPVDLKFLPGGDALLLTFDGDVYRLSGLGRDDTAVRWRRVAAGFNEPQSLALRGAEVFVFSRLGIVRLEDRDGDGETDFYAMFSNRFTQSGDTRDFPLSLVVRGDGSLMLSKGGQQQDAKSPHSGRALWVSPDGRTVEPWATGLRNAYLDLIPGRDLIVASDQQGHWVPSTPFHVVRRGSYLGFDPAAADPAAAVHPPALWLPHRIAQSGIDPVWGGDPRLGSLHGTVLYVDYTRPSVTKIFVPAGDDFRQTAGLPLPLEFEVPLLKGAINPADGRAYFAGFQVWDSRARRLEGLCRIRLLQPKDDLPVGAEVFREGLLVTFAEPLDAAAALDPNHYRLGSWDYRRTAEYGSSYYRADGTPGVDEHAIHAVLLSADRRSVFVAIAGLAPAMQLELQYRVGAEWAPVFFTAHELPPAALDARGFVPTDLAALLAGPPAPRDEHSVEVVVSELRGQQVATMYGCVACHSLDGSTAGRTGPSWRNIYDRPRPLADGTTRRADDAYLREAILEPAKTIVRGYENAEVGMPPYQGVLKDEDVASLILYIRSLK